MVGSLGLRTEGGWEPEVGHRDPGKGDWKGQKRWGGQNLETGNFRPGAGFTLLLKLYQMCALTIIIIRKQRTRKKVASF